MTSKSPARQAALPRANRVWLFLKSALRALLADAEGWARGLPGHRFGLFGRRIGARVALAGARSEGAAMLLTPVNSVRYWEFDFADRELSLPGGQALDVSSPRLLSLYLAHRQRFERITVMNPDSSDLSDTESIARVCRLDNVSTRLGPVSDLASSQDRYSAIWSISVIEHIPGDVGDTVAVRAMFDALVPGGVLVVTVPTDRRTWSEYRDTDVYGLGLAVEADGSYFFQRYYDAGAIKKRLIGAIGVEPRTVSWFGERRAGTFARYERKWRRDGADVTLADPAFVAREFRTYSSWGQMPGMGICGLAFAAPAAEPTQREAARQ